MDVHRQPPKLAGLVKALRAMSKTGLLIYPDLQDPRLLNLCGVVVARSIDRGARLSRGKTLDGVIRKLSAHYPGDPRGEVARALFGMASGARGRSLMDLREQADYFWKRIESRISRQLARQLHSDSQNDIPRGRQLSPPFEISGDTPYLSVGDMSAKDKAEREEATLVTLGTCPRPTRRILPVERPKVWPHDNTEPDLCKRQFGEAPAMRNGAVNSVKKEVYGYVDRYRGEALLRLAG